MTSLVAICATAALPKLQVRTREPRSRRDRAEINVEIHAEIHAAPQAYLGESRSIFTLGVVMAAGPALGFTLRGPSMLPQILNVVLVLSGYAALNALRPALAAFASTIVPTSASARLFSAINVAE